MRYDRRGMIADVLPSAVSARTLRGGAAGRARSPTACRRGRRASRRSGLDVEAVATYRGRGARALAHGVDRLVERAAEPLLAEHVGELLRSGRRRRRRRCSERGPEPVAGAERRGDRGEHVRELPVERLHPSIRGDAQDDERNGEAGKHEQKAATGGAPAIVPPSPSQTRRARREREVTAAELGGRSAPRVRFSLSPPGRSSRDRRPVRNAARPDSPSGVSVTASRRATCRSRSLPIARAAAPPPSRPRRREIKSAASSDHRCTRTGLRAIDGGRTPTGPVGSAREP